MVDVLAMPVLVGLKTAEERFAGADQHVHLRGDDGRRQGAADGHQPRARPELRPASSTSSTSTTPARSRPRWTTSWGVSTRMVGGLIMAHGDDDGLRVPPRVGARSRSSCSRSATRATSSRAAARSPSELTAAGVRASLDAHADVSFGRRATDWELKGVPVRLELGPRDLADGVVTLVRRVTGGEERKVPVAPRRRRRRGHRRARPSAARRCSPRRPRCARRAPPTSSTLDEAREAAADRLGPDPVGGRGREGRGRARPGRGHRPLPAPGPTARCPTPTTEPDLVAVVAARRTDRRSVAMFPSSPRCRRCSPSWRASSPPAAARWATIFEPKWDGFRAIVFRDGDEIEIGSRNEKPLTRYFPELIEPLRARRCPSGASSTARS